MKASPLRPVEGRVPPHNLDAEGAVLSAVLLAGDPDLSEMLRPEHFYSDANRLIYSAIVKVREAGDPVDVVTVAAYLKRNEQLERVGGTPYLGLLTDAVPAVANVGAYAAIVHDAWQKRELIRQCHLFAAEAYTAPTSGHELVAQAEAVLADLATAGASNRFAAVGEVAAAEVERMMEAKRLGLSTLGLSTGYKGLDRLTAGLHPGDLIVVAGRPGHGKSSFAMNLATNVVRDGSTAAAVFSLEMPRSQLAIRIACAEGNVDAGAVRRNVLSHTQWVDLVGAVDRIHRMPMWIDDTPGVSLADVRARTKKLQRGLSAGRHGPCQRLGLIVIDYLQLMRGVRSGGDSREQEVSSLTRGLKEMAKELGLPVVLLSQLNRKTEERGDHRPQLSHLRESGAIEQDADSVWFIYRPDMYDREAPQGDCDLIIAKQRNGPLDDLPLKFVASTTRFHERDLGSYAVEEFDVSGPGG